MGEAAESWRVSEVLRDPWLKQRVAAWEQANAPHLAPRQRQVLTKLATCVWDMEAERALDGDRPLEEMSQDAQKWAEFASDHEDVKKQYNRLMARAVRNGLFAYPQYCRQYYRDHHDKVRVRFVVLNEAHPLVLEWVGMRRVLGDKALHCFWRTEHSALCSGVPQPLLGSEGEVDLAEDVLKLLRKGQSWESMFHILQPKIRRLLNKQGKVRLDVKEALRKWAIANNLVEARPPEVSPREAREIQQRAEHEMQQRVEIIQTLQLTPQPSGGYIARVHTASGDQIEAQERDGIGALLKLTQSLWNRFPGEQHQPGADT